MVEARIGVEVIAKVDKFTADLAKATKTLDSMKHSLAIIKFDALTNLGQKAVQVAQQIYQFGRGVASSLNDIQRQASMVGMTTDKFQEFAYVAKMADVGVGDFMQHMKLLANNMEAARKGTGDTADTFKALGISTEYLKSQEATFENVLKRVIQEFSQYSDGAGKAAALNNIFGRSGISMTQFVNQGSKGFDGLIKKFHEYGFSIGKDVIEAGSKAEDSFKNFEMAIEKLKSASLPLISILTKIVDWLTKIALKASEAANNIGKVWGNPDIDLLTGQPIGKAPNMGWKDTWGREQIKGISKPFPVIGGKPEDLSDTRKMADLLGKAWMEAYAEGLEVEYSKVEEVYVKIKDGVFKLRDQIVPAMGVPQGTETWYTQSEAVLNALEKMAAEEVKMNPMFMEDSQNWKIIGDNIERAKEEAEKLLHIENERLEKLESYMFEIRKVSGLEYETPTPEQTQGMDMRSLEEGMKKFKETEKVMMEIGSNISGIWSTHMMSMLKGTESFAEGVKGIMGDMADFVIKKILEMIATYALFGNLKGTYSSGSGLLGIAGSLLKLADGGYVTKPTVAMIGERGPEAVIPMDKMSNMGGSNNYVTIIAADAKSFSDMIERNPGAVLKIVNSDARGHGGMRSTMRAYG